MLKRYAALAALSLACVAAPALAESSAPQVRTLDVYVDLPTGFTFVKMPAGWKFVGKLDAAQLRELPPTALTSLLPAEEEATRLTDAGLPAGATATLANSSTAAAPTQAR
jgi:hypothetical protein